MLTESEQRRHDQFDRLAVLEPCGSGQTFGAMPRDRTHRLSFSWAALNWQCAGSKVASSWHYIDGQASRDSFKLRPWQRCLANSAARGAMRIRRAGCANELTCLPPPASCWIQSPPTIGLRPSTCFCRDSAGHTLQSVHSRPGDQVSRTPASLPCPRRSAETPLRRNPALRRRARRQRKRQRKRAAKKAATPAAT